MKTTRRFGWLIAATVFALSAAGPAQASLIGQSVNCSTNQFIPVCSPSSTTVGPGQEFTVAERFGPLFGIDVGDSSIMMSSIIGAGINADPIANVSLEDLIWSNDITATITGIENFVASGVSGLDSGDITTAANAIIIDYGGSSWAIDGFISFNLVTSHDNNDIPEPSTLALFLIALGGLGFMARRRVT